MPLGEAMISSLKSNKSIRLDKSRRFRKTLGGYAKSKNTTCDVPKATPSQLKVIRQKLEKENQRLTIKTICISAVISISLVLMFFYKSKYLAGF
ncbi:MAG: hypothetical protein AB8B52_07185 [Winogradskyella sp.]|uniref:hypothetical protein n=1 Tax=Winogradskyella sp. TaxID=1883156 RepID=UPI003859D543